MAFYPDSPTLYDVMQTLFERINATPGAADDFHRVGLTVHVNLANPDAFFGLSGKGKPIGLQFTPNGQRADIALRLEADLLHQIWLGQARLRDAYFGGQIKTQGSVFKVLQLAPLFRQAETLYPQVLREKGLLTG